MSEDKLIQLVTKEFIGELTFDESIELKSLLEDTLLKERYDFLKLYLSNSFDDHSSDAAIFDKVQQKISLQQASDRHLGLIKYRSFWKVAVAAVLILTSMSVFLLYRKESPAQQIVQTNRASKTSIVLSDGTRVTLNSESKLLYPSHFTGSYREVTLIGEGFFDVVKDSGHPFIIHASKMNIKVLGTAFNVKAYPNDRFSETSLLRGLVEVTLDDRPSDRITLKPSEKLIVRNTPLEGVKKSPFIQNEALTQVTNFQKDDSIVVETSWMDNRIIFNDQTFAEIANMLERAYNVEIYFRSEDLKSLKLTGSFERESIDDILKTLSLVEPFSYKIQNKQIVINQL
jgi:ferric-dicitrate binding protein FerR (iron transport regulator)